MSLINDYLCIMRVKELFIKAVKDPFNLVKRLYIVVTNRIVRIIDGTYDKALCGHNLSKRREVQIEGGVFYQPSCYWALCEIFKDAVFSPEDHFVDIGCGMGRVLVYLRDRKFPGYLTGIEYDPYVASVAREWIEKDKTGKVNLIEGDALKEYYNQYQIVYLFRPFSEDFFMRLITRLEEQLTHPIRLYYLTDFYARKYLTDRQGWNMVLRRSVFMKYGLCLYRSPQYYSIWNYCPTNIAN